MVDLVSDLAWRTLASRFAEQFATAADLMPDGPDKWQADLLDADDRNIIVCCSRQVGKSATTGVKAAHHGATTDRGLILITSPSERQSIELLLRVKGVVRGARFLDTSKDTMKYLEFTETGTRCFALPGHEKTIRSFSAVTLLIIDEAARVVNALYNAVTPMLAVSHGQCILLSTPWYKSGFFYDEWEKGDGWRRFQVKAPECPRLTPEFLARERGRRGLTEAGFRREYMCEFQELEDVALGLDWFDRATGKATLPQLGRLRDQPDPDFVPLFGGRT